MLAEFLTAEANRSWTELDARGGVFPAALVAEMRGFADGCRHANPLTPVTFERVVTINYGFDWLSANVFAGMCDQCVGCDWLIAIPPPTLTHTP